MYLRLEAYDAIRGSVYVARRRLDKGQKISKANYGFLDSPKS